MVSDAEPALGSSLAMALVVGGQVMTEAYKRIEGLATNECK
jgi:hypothetical protein